jgi:2-polyprenyl-3-methyl-5-hydroxy-6-metoxy-1,4-benzoquinol methylase
VNNMNNKANLEYVPCAICGKKDQSHFLSKNGFDLVKCNSCGLVFVSPRLKKEFVFQRYSKDYFINEYLPDFLLHKEDKRWHYIDLLNNLVGWRGYILKKNSNKLTPNIIKRVMGLFGRRENAPKKPLSLFEVGCGTGYMVKIAEDEFSIHSKGVELNPYFVEYAEKEFGLGGKVFCADIDEFDFAGTDKADIIIMNDVIEHLLNPRKVLIKCNKLMNKNGIMFLSTPNIEGESFKLLRDGWQFIGPTEHLYYFSADTILRLLDKTGFRVLAVDYGDPGKNDVLYVYCENK